MLHISNIKFKIVGLAFISIFIGGLFCDDTYAACADGSVTCVSVQFGQPVGDRSVDPSSNVYSATQFYLPVAINIERTAGYTVDYSIKVYGSGSSLTNVADSNYSIPSVLQNTSFNDLGKDGSQWGIRWNLGDQVSDSYSDYHPVPTSIDDPSAVVITDGKVGADTSSLTKQLTLGFAVAVDGSQASGSYSNTVTVAVVASPKDARTIFDISTMQEMTPEICEHTTTPAATTLSTSSNINVTSAGANYTTAIDTTGTYEGDDTYVPQKELVDTRDGKKYTVRKLADGNCWMVSNLEFDFVPTANKTYGQTPAQSAFSTTGTDTLTGSQLILTNKDTDLNTMREWTPAIAAETYGTAGKVYRTQINAGSGGTNNNGSAVSTTITKWGQDGSDGLRSFSNAAAYPSEPYSTKTNKSGDVPVFGTATTGLPWQRFGNLYNWTAATLGSGATAVDDGQNATDSICPRGWKLPSNTGSSSFFVLLGTYNFTVSNSAATNRFANFPLNLMRTGVYYPEGNMYYRTSGGVWWSDTSKDTTSSYNLRTGTTFGVAPQHVYGRGNGVAIRCVARK